MFDRYFHNALLGVKTEYETAKYSYDFSNTVINKCTHTLSLLEWVLARPTFGWQSRFQCNGSHVLKWATILRRKSLVSIYVFS